METQKLLKPPLLQRNIPESAKYRLFRLFHQILIHFSIDNKLYSLFLIIELLQLIHYAVFGMYVGLWKSEITGIVQKILSFSNLSGLWELTGYWGILCLICISKSMSNVDLLYCILVGVFFLYQVFKKPQFRQVNIVAVKLIMYYFTLLRTLLFLPLIHAFSTSINPNYYQIPSELTPVFAAISSVSLILVLVFSILCSTFMVDNCPFAALPFAGPINSLELAKFGIKSVLGVAGALMTHKEPIDIILCMFLALSFGFLVVKLYFTARQFASPFKYLNELVPVTTLWVSITSLLQQLTSPQQSIGLLFVLIGCVCINLTWFWVKSSRQKNIIRMNYRNVSSSVETIQYNYLSINCVNNYEKAGSLILLEGILSYHSYNCRKTAENCVCHSVRDTMSSMGLEPERPEILTEKKLWFEFIKSNLTQVKGKYRNNTEITLLLAFIQNQQLSNKFRALQNLEEPSHFQNGLKLEFMNYHFRRKIEDRIYRQDHIENQKKSVDVNRFIQFQMKYFKLEQLIEKSTNDHLRFWCTLKSETLTKNKILEGGRQIFRGVDKIYRLYEELSSINPNNLYCVILYSNFMKIIANSPEVYEKNMESMASIKKSIALGGKISNDVQKAKYGENSITGVIIISGQRKNIGVIKHCSSKAKQLLDYASHELVSQNINTIMPKFIGNMHDDVLRNYLELSVSEYDFIQRLAPMVDKNNFMRMARIFTKPLPSLLNGLELVGLFSPIFQWHMSHPNEIPKYILYRSDTQQIEAVSESCFIQFGYRLTKLDETQETGIELNMSTLFSNVSQIDKATPDKGVSSLISYKDVDGILNHTTVMTYLRHQIVYFGVKLKLIYFFVPKSFNDITHGQSTYGPHKKIIGINKELEIADSKKNSNEKNDLRDKLKPSFQPLTMKVVRKLGILCLLVMVTMGSVYLVMDLQRSQLIFSYQRVSELGAKSIGQMMEINFYSRIMHLSHHYPSQLSEYTTYQNILRRLTSSLQKNTFQLVRLELQAASAGFQSKDSDINRVFQVSLEGSVTQSIKTLDINIFDYITSSSTFQSTEKSLLSFPLKLEDSLNGTPVTQSFANLFYIRYTGLFSTIQAKQIYLNTLKMYFSQKVMKAQTNSMIRFVISVAVLLSLTVISIPLVYSIVQITHRIILLFGYISYTDIEFQVKNCEIFLDVFYADSYMVKLVRKSSNKQNVIRSSSYDADEIKLDQKFRKQSGMVKLSTFHSDIDVLMKTGGDRFQQSNITSNKLELLQKKFQQLSSRQIIPLEQNNQKPNDHKSIKEQLPKIYVLQKLQKSSDNTKLNFAIFSISIAMLFFAYFLCVFLLNSKTSQFHVNILEKFQVLLKNQYLLKGVKLYGLEATIDNSLFKNFPLLSEQSSEYAVALYAQQRTLNELLYRDQVRNGWISAEIFQSNIVDVCLLLPKYIKYVNIQPLSSYSQEECQELEDKILQQGLRTAIVAFTQLIGKLQTEPNVQSMMQSRNFYSMFRIDKYIEGAHIYYQQLLKEELIYNIENNKKIIGSIFAAFIAVSLLVFVVIWRRFLAYIKCRLRASIQILKLIPKRAYEANSDLDKEYTRITQEVMP